MNPGRIVSSVAVLLTLLLFSACVSLNQPSGNGKPAPPNAAEGAVYRVDLKEGKLAAVEIEPPPREIPADPESLPQKPPPGPDPLPQKLHPRLLEWLDEHDSSEIVRVVIAFEDSVEIPRFPALDPHFPRDYPENQQALAEAESLVHEIEGARLPIYAEHLEMLAARYEAHVTETFWLIDAVVANMPLWRVPELAKERDDVVSISPVDSGDPPPQDDSDDELCCEEPGIRDTEPRNNVIKGRDWIASDPYFDLGLTEGYIGLLDSGVRFTHKLFDPARLDIRRDCVNGGADCNTGRINPDDDCWNHGTSSAAILTGNSWAGKDFRGVTEITLDSFKVYPSTFKDCQCKGDLDTDAAVRGFHAAVAVLDQVIVAEIEGSGGERGPISLAANAAFDAGAVVVAANGNFGNRGCGTVKEPASAARVLGVGNFHVITRDRALQSRGPTIDNRIKPDFQAPTFTETASTGCCFGFDCNGRGSDEAFKLYSATSGATPYAGGAAALLRNLIARVMKTKKVDPGLVYALMILSGQEPAFNNDIGTGQLQLPPTDGTTLRWGVAFVKDQRILEIPISFDSPQGQLDAALWWPEDGVAKRHNDIDLEIVDPRGVVRGESLSVPSVFERARSLGPLQGVWKIRIYGASVRSPRPQRVYFAILNR